MTLPGPDDEFGLETLRAAERYQRWILDSFSVDLSGDVLEVGAGVGSFTRWLARRARHVTALEPDDRRRGRIEALGMANVSTLALPVEQLVEHEPGHDAALLVNVLEHLADDRAALRAVRDMLLGGGRVCVLVPAHGALFGTLDRAFGHHRRYSRRAVGNLLHETGFAVERLHYFNPLGAPGWFVLGRVLRRQSISPFAVAATERLLVPLGRLLERLGRPPFGQSVLAVGRRIDGTTDALRSEQ